MPGAQLLHSVMPGLARYLPRAQLRQTDAPGPEALPSAHSTQPVKPATAWYWPAAHGVQRVMLAEAA